MNRFHYPARALALLLLGTFAGCGHGPAADVPSAKNTSNNAAAPTVAVASVGRGTIEQTLPATGTLAALRDRQATVTPLVAGMLDELSLRLGQRVYKGQVIAHLSTHVLQGQIQQAQATIAQNEVQVQQAQVNALQQQAQSSAAILQAQSAVSGAKATLGGAQATLTGAQATLTGNEAALNNADQNLARVQTLFKDGLVARKDVEAAQLARRTAQAQLDAQKQTVDAQKQTVDAQKQTVASQEAALQAAHAAALQNRVRQNDIQIARQQVRNAKGAQATARAQMALYTIRAPLTGIVTNVGVAVGETVDTTKQIATIANLDTLQLQIAVPSVSASRVHPGELVSFRVDSLPNLVFRSQVRSVGPQVDPVNNTVPVLALIANTGHRLRDNMSARVWIITERHTGALLVPKSAVLFGADGKASVVVVGADDVAHTRDVKTGLVDGNSVEILSGVSPGVRLATSGGYGLPDGTKVVVVDGAASKKVGTP